MAHNTRLAIIGAGIAGLCAAITAQAELDDIWLFSKGPLGACGSSFQNINKCWGLAYAADDRECSYLLDRINLISRGTNDPDLSSFLVEESFRAFIRLKNWGIRFRTGEGGAVQRVVPCFCEGERLAAVVDDLPQFWRKMQKIIDQDRVRILSWAGVTELSRENDHWRLVVQNESERFDVLAQAVIVASGGDAACWEPNIVDSGLRGDGYRLLHALGASLVNMDYKQRIWDDVEWRQRRFNTAMLFDSSLQFRTSAREDICLPSAGSLLGASRRMHDPISNLQDDAKFDQPLLDAYRETGPLQVWRGNELVNTISPHTMASNGGVRIGRNAEVGLEGLFAAGEVAGGMHGGDRVGGMMIASCLVFGTQAAKSAVNYLSL